MAITKCRIWLRSANRLTATTRALRHRGRTNGGWSALVWIEKIMSKTSNVWTLDHDTLADSEMDTATGGTVADMIRDVWEANNTAIELKKLPGKTKPATLVLK